MYVSPTFSWLVVQEGELLLRKVHRCAEYLVPSTALKYAMLLCMLAVHIIALLGFKLWRIEDRGSSQGLQSNSVVVSPRANKLGS